MSAPMITITAILAHGKAARTDSGELNTNGTDGGTNGRHEFGSSPPGVADRHRSPLGPTQMCAGRFTYCEHDRSARRRACPVLSVSLRPDPVAPRTPASTQTGDRQLAAYRAYASRRRRSRPFNGRRGLHVEPGTTTRVRGASGSLALQRPRRRRTSWVHRRDTGIHSTRR